MTRAASCPAPASASVIHFANAARRMHNRVSELEPANVDARLVQGLHDYIVGSLPWTYRMLGFMIGVHGDKARGIRTVQDVALTMSAIAGPDARGYQITHTTLYAKPQAGADAP